MADIVRDSAVLGEVRARRTPFVSARATGRGMAAVLALTACSACAQPADYETDPSESAKIVRALLQAAEAGNSREAAAALEPAARLVYQADVGTELNVASLRRYVLPRLEDCGPRKIKQTFHSKSQSVVLVGCAEPRQRSPLDGREISFFISNGKISGANTNDAMIMEKSVDG